MDKDEDNDKDESNKEPKQIRRRVKKSESGDRNHVCEYCQKSYLSYPALYTHIRIKHNTNNKLGGHPGRPKKLDKKIKDPFDPTTFEFFKKEERKGHTPHENINECAKKAFLYLYQNEIKNIEKRQMKYYDKIEEHPFFSKFIKDIHDEQKLEKENSNIDNVLINYLNIISILCNENYYEKIIVFITLFREFVNIFKKLDDNDQEYTAKKEAEDVPDTSNEFINEFLFPEQEESSFGFEKEEAISLIRNLCSWMYENNFTGSKLFMAENKENQT